MRQIKGWLYGPSPKWLLRTERFVTGPKPRWVRTASLWIGVGLVMYGLDLDLKHNLAFLFGLAVITESKQ